MKYLFSLLIILLTLSSGCTDHRRGTRTVTTTWNNKRQFDNPLVETIKALKGTPTGNTGRGFQAQSYTSQTKANMGVYYRGK